MGDNANQSRRMEQRLMQRLPFPWGSSLAVLMVLAASGTARAQTSTPGTSTSIDSQTFWPAAGPGEHLSLRSSSVSPAWGVGFGLITNFSRLPLRTCAPAMGGMPGNCASQTSPNLANVVDYALTSDFGFSLGLFDRLQVMIAVPVVVAQSGVGALTVEYALTPWERR